LGLFATLLFSGPIALVLNSDLSMAQFAHDAWLRRHGMPVLVITQTHDGFIWPGTPAGLSRFDGVKFTEEPINPTDLSLHEFISNLCAAPGNTLWIGVRNGGLQKLKNGVPTAIDFGSADPTVRALHLDTRGTLRIGNSSNLY
jgi:ligand-binding sensor domain-containing protein